MRFGRELELVDWVILVLLAESLLQAYIVPLLEALSSWNSLLFLALLKSLGHLDRIYLFFSQVEK